MKKLILSGLFCFLLQIVSTAQQRLDENAYIDSLSKAVQAKQTDSARCRTLLELSDAWSYIDVKRSAAYLAQARKTARSNSFLQGLYYFYQAGNYFDNNASLSKKTYLRADSLLAGFKTKEAYLYRTRAWLNYGSLLQRNDEDKAYLGVLLKKAIPLAKLSGNTVRLGTCYQYVGMVFMNLMQYDKAEPYYAQAITLLEKAGADEDYLANIYNLAARNYLYSNKLRPAKKLIDKHFAVIKNFQPTNVVFVEYYHNQVMYYQKTRQYGLAFGSANKGIALAKKLNKPYEEQMMLFQKFRILREQKRYQEGKVILLELIQGKQPIVSAANRTIYYRELAGTYAKLNDYANAYQWLIRYTTLNDSLANARYSEQFNELEAKFKHTENQKRIGLLEAEKAQVVLEAKNTRLYNWLLSAACLVLVLLAAFSFIYYRNARKLAVQKEINHRQQLKDMEQQQQLSATKAMLEGEERERERLARDLHDGLGGMLAGVKMNLSGWAQSHVLQQNTDLHKVIGQLDHSVGELRRIARNMMPETLLKFGLETALKDLCEFYMREDMHISFQPFNLKNNSALQVQINIYRIAQELLSNAIRHADAQNIVLQCSQSDEGFMITVEDDGVGFDTTVLTNKKGIGLNNLKNRVEYQKGRMEIISSPGEGTTVNIELNSHAA